ncbi:hypothetical protein FB566_3089 [Stackebrandtia endophytica]|uniref:Uncharacterized protein n=1 Tax=Stackebrandtia endophytica TaxID=1496996 RepID=A0A543AYC3_9ACTN|nr:hypothetical protein [Stackebrandtia endophytica]TQL77530.1 hypothetical protein FB566_3089 [Stackebrandtia endophytica]
MNPRATVGDVDWIDVYGEARICGHQVRKTDLLTMERAGDRRPDGHLTGQAKERIARELTGRLRDREAQALAAWNAQGPPGTWRHCEG